MKQVSGKEDAHGVSSRQLQRSGRASPGRGRWSGDLNDKELLRDHQQEKHSRQREQHVQRP